MSGDNGQHALEALVEAAKSTDPDAVENALYNAFQVSITSEYAPVLIELLGMPWHHEHENIVSELQKLRDPRAIEPLYRAALVCHAYLDYDESFALARKCTWALADIGTIDAQSRLKSLACAENAIIAQYAQKRLDRWQDEMARKGGRI
jgi:hypothetical protein